MTNNATFIQKYSFSPSDALLVDTNVWIYIYAPQKPNDWRTATYSSALKRMLSAGSNLIVALLVISEFINRYCRMQFHLTSQETGLTDFKDFRESTFFHPVARAVTNLVRRILQHSTYDNTGLESTDINSLITDFETDYADFNDLVLAGLCKSNGWTLVTHDSDFKDAGLAILTANRRLI